MSAPECHKQLLQHLAACLGAYQPNKVVLALSGGLDSMVLLQLLHQLQPQAPWQLHAVHVHHGLQPDADQWLLFCQQQCQQRGIAFFAHHLQLTGQGNLEARARTARYQALEPYCDTTGSLLLTAHHADDQLETLLLALKRGSGLAGLSGIAAYRPFAAGSLVRPLLPFTRAELVKFAEQQQLCWVEDASNQDNRFDRNFLRQNILPRLTERWPAFAETASRSMAHCAEANQQLAAMTAELATNCISSDGELKLSPLTDYPKIQQDAIIRHWLASYQLNPEQRWLGTLRRDVIEARQDASPVLQLADWQVRRFNDRLYLLAANMIEPSEQTLLWQGEGELSLPGGLGRLLFRQERPEDSLAWLPLQLSEQEATVCFGRMSSDFKPAGAQHHKTLKQWCQLWLIPPWQRHQLPLLFEHDRLLAVAGQASCFHPEQANLWLCYHPGESFNMNCKEP
ncbi:MAG: tRNA lysidine(34) synthetase TilS [Alkalimonas sp.]|nr:tRNA lysidine(34) synthetase TilS [Alkalimonas sp.]